MNAKSISVAAACLALLALPAWQQTTLASLQKQRDHLGTGSSPGASRAKVNSGSAFAPQAHPGNGPRPIRSILQLARIKDPLEREAALALWVGGLATNEAILSAIESLKNHPASTPHLRAIIAPHLTRQWALVDPESCIDAFLQSATLHDENPFGAPELSTWSAGFFSLVATTNPEAFERWASNAPDDLFAALIRDPNSDLLKAWAGGDLVPAPRQGPGDALRAILKTAVRFAPELILDIAAEYPESRIAQQQLREWSLVRSLLARHESVDGVWPLLDKLPAGKGSSHLLDALANLSIGEASFEDALATASQRDPGTRQARELDILGKKLADQLGRLGEGELGREDDVWDQLERFAGVINGSASADDPAYDVTRARMAAIAGDADPEVATNWVRSIQDPVTRLRSAGALAARMHADGNYDGSRVSLAQNLGGEDGSFSLRYMMASQDSRMQASMELGKLRIGPERSVDEIMEAVREALDRPDVANMLATISAPHQP